MTRYAKLHPEFVRATIDALKSRIAVRFPDSGLAQVGAELLSLADQNHAVIERLRRPLWLGRPARPEDSFFYLARDGEPLP